MSERLFPLIRPVYEGQREFDAAKRAIDENPDLQITLQQQMRFDDQVVAELSNISLSDQQIEQLENFLVERPEQNIDPETLIEPVVPTPPVVPPPAPEPAGPTVPTATPRAQPIKDQTAPDPPPESKVTEQPASTEQKAAEEEEEEEPRARTGTIVAAVSIGLIATIALIAYIVWDQMNTFRGADRVAELLDSANTLTGDEFEAVSTTTANLKDWFFLKSDMRWFAVPKEFADTNTLGCRVFKFQGADVGQILAKSDEEVLLFLFRPADLGVKIQKGKWAVVEGERWVGGVTAVDNCCFIVAFKGTHNEMQTYLDKKLKK